MPLFLLLIALALSIVTVVGLGHPIMQMIGIPSPTGRLMLGGGLGLGIVALAGALIGLLLGWDPWLWIIVIAAPVLSLPGAYLARNDVRGLFEQVRWWWSNANNLERVLILVSAAAIFLVVVHAALPPTLTDDARTYLQGPRLQLVEGHLTTPPEDHFMLYAANRQVLSVIATYIWDFRLVRLFGVVITILLIGLVTLLARLYVGKREAVMILPIMLANPAVSGMAASGKVDLLVAAYLTCVVLTFEFLPGARSKLGTALLAGAFFGLALGTKPTALFYIPVLAVWMGKVWLAMDGEVRRSSLPLPQTVLAVVAGALVAYSPWIVREWMEFGMPFAPLLDSPDKSGGIGTMIAGLPTTLVKAAMIPYLLSFKYGAMPVFFWVTVVVGMLLSLKMRNAWFLLLIGVLTLTSITVASGVNPWMYAIRMMLFGFLLLSVVSAIGVRWILTMRIRWLRYVLGLASIVLLSFPVLSTVVLGGSSARVALGIRPIDEYVDRYIGSHEAIAWARENWTWTDTVWATYVPDLMYYKGRIFLGPAQQMSDVGPELDALLASPEAFCNGLREHTMDYAFFGPDYIPERNPEIERICQTCMDTVFISSDHRYVILKRSEAIPDPR